MPSIEDSYRCFNTAEEHNEISPAISTGEISPAIHLRNLPGQYLFSQSFKPWFVSCRQSHSACPHCCSKPFPNAPAIFFRGTNFPETTAVSREEIEDFFIKMRKEISPFTLQGGIFELEIFFHPLVPKKMKEPFKNIKIKKARNGITCRSWAPTGTWGCTWYSEAPALRRR